MTNNKRDIEEALGIIQHFKEHGECGACSISEKVKEGVSDTIVDDLVSKRLIEMKDDKVRLTGDGEKIALDVTRRHRLAERLLFDVLEMTKEHIDKIACEFEHIISPEVTDSICTLLGHPRACPHGSPIPEGECCRKAETMIKSIVVPLTEFPVGEKGKITYIVTGSHPQLHKVLSLGVVPGVEITLHQKNPSYVIVAGQTQIAMDKELASQIFIKR